MRRNYIQPTIQVEKAEPMSLLMTSGGGGGDRSINTNVTGLGYNPDGGSADYAF